MPEKLPRPNFKSFLAPDEDLKQVNAIYAALAEELKPTTYLEVRQIELIVLCDLEMARHRRLSANHLAFSSNEIQKQALARRLAKQGDEVEGQEAAQLKPEDMHQIVAKAYAANIETHAYHEASAAKIEARRRSLLRDYEALKKHNARQHIEEAQIIEETPKDLGEDKR
jgi:hypothetical protein